MIPRIVFGPTVWLRPFADPSRLVVHVFHPNRARLAYKFHFLLRNKFFAQAIYSRVRLDRCSIGKMLFATADRDTQ